MKRILTLLIIALSLTPISNAMNKSKKKPKPSPVSKTERLYAEKLEKFIALTEVKNLTVTDLVTADDLLDFITHHQYFNKQIANFIVQEMRSLSFIYYPKDDIDERMKALIFSNQLIKSHVSERVSNDFQKYFYRYNIAAEPLEESSSSESSSSYNEYGWSIGWHSNHTS